MQVTRIESKAGGEIVSNETFDISSKDYKVIRRMWVASDGRFIREWTTDEYINFNPKIPLIMPFSFGEVTLDVQAHCIELREYRACKDGNTLALFTKFFDYSKND